jgi:arginyl-tRNA synthetase
MSRYQKAKPISVKIATVKVIKALEEKLIQFKKDYLAQESLDKKYEKEVEAYRKGLIEYALANAKSAQNFRTNYRNYTKTLNIDFDITVDESKLPKEPERNYVIIHTSEYNDTVYEIENAVRILKMTDEEVVSTSTYNAIARYL